MKVVVDTSGWYAGAVRVDINHPEARQFLTSAEDLLVLMTVFEETLALLQSRQGKSLAIKNGEAMQAWDIKDLTEDEMLAAWMLYRDTNREVSYVDCTVVIISKKYNLPVFGFDAHIRKLGIQLVP